MGCSTSKRKTVVLDVDNKRKAPDAKTNEDLKIFSFASSDLQRYASVSSSSCAADNKCERFSLKMARDLATVCRLSYLDSVFWASAKKGQGNTSEGLKGVSPIAKLWLGALAREGIVSRNPLQVHMLGSEFDTAWDNGKGTLIDGLISHTSSDTEGMLLLRPSLKEVIVVMRGTEGGGGGKQDRTTDLMFGKVKAYGGKVHKGILRAWRNVENAVLTTLQKIFQPANGSPSYNSLILCGHSLGGGLATLALASVLERFGDRVPKLQLYTYGGAVVGDPAFKRKLESTPGYSSIGIFRVVNGRDIIPTLGKKLGFVHVGKLVFINHHGLWIDPENLDTLQEKDLRESADSFLHHQMGNGYSKLLESFRSRCDLSWSGEPSGSRPEGLLSSSDIEEKLSQAWRIYLAADEEVLHKVKPEPVINPEGDAIEVLRVLSPNIKGLIKFMTDTQNFPGLTEEHVNLIIFEMFRLRRWFGSKTLDWHVFSMACFNLFFKGENTTSMMFYRKQARAFENFTTYDIDGDNFLYPARFTHFYENEHPGYDREELMRIFRQIDLDPDDTIHFSEYILLVSIQQFQAQERQTLPCPPAAGRAPPLPADQAPLLPIMGNAPRVVPQEGDMEKSVQDVSVQRECEPSPILPEFKDSEMSVKPDDAFSLVGVVPEAPMLA